MTTKGKFASDTTVTAERSMAEIMGVLKKYGAKKYAFVDEAEQIGVAFEMRDRRVRFVLALPKPGEVRVKVNQTNATRVSQSAYEQAIRQKWRALLLAIRAKLESVESGIETFEEAFLAQLVLPSGETMGQWAVPQIEQAYLGRLMPPLLNDRN